MQDFGSQLKGLSSVLETYLCLRTDDFKKNLVAGLSAGFSRALSIMVIVTLLLVVLAVFAFAFIILIGDAIGSWSGAAFIVGGVYLAGVFVLYLKRKTLFLNMFSNMFSSIADAYAPQESLKSLLLVIIRALKDYINPSSRP